MTELAWLGWAWTRRTKFASLNGVWAHSGSFLSAKRNWEVIVGEISEAELIEWEVIEGGGC